jgi:hypothetical protein
MKPKQAIRRFDVFAEYRKQEEEDKGTAQDVAKGYGLWVAKVVAARKFGRLKPKERGKDKGEEREEREEARLVDGKWHVLSDEPQTDALFDKQIVQRMGKEFYEEVFAPAIRAARKQGKTYESIRDSIRKDWKS